MTHKARNHNYVPDYSKFVQYYGATTKLSADIGYFVILSGLKENQAKIFPLIDGEYLIARASSLKSLLSYFNLRDGSKQKVICLPRKPGPRTIIKLGRIIVKNSNTDFLPGWPVENLYEKIIKGSWLNSTEIEINKSSTYNLKGFEILIFSGDPKVEILYIPPISKYSGLISNRLLEELERFGLWVSAAQGWKKLEEYDRAIYSLDQALKTSLRFGYDNITQANILLLKANMMKNVQQDSNEIIANQRQAFSLLGLPMLDVHVQGKIALQEKPFYLKIYIHNTSSQQAANGVQIVFNCDELGIYKRLKFGPLLPRQENKKAFGVRSVYKKIQGSEKFNAKIVVEFYTSTGGHYELLIEDFIEIVEKRSFIDVEGDAGVITVEVDRDTIPDIHVGQDAAFIKIKKGN